MTERDIHIALIIFALLVMFFGTIDFYREQEALRAVSEITNERNCWERKAQEHTLGYRDRRC
jgi:hypothetical protein